MMDPSAGAETDTVGGLRSTVNWMLFTPFCKAEMLPARSKALAKTRYCPGRASGPEGRL